MYQVLYRKYRPKVFDDVVGQTHITTTLKNELKTGRVNHAYLFTGSRGTGKTTCAKILSKAVNCLDLKNGDPCCTCDICKDIESGNVMDVVEMDAASNRGISDIKTIIEEVNFTPAKAKYRVYIIDEVHMLTTEAFNALLKTLEEPPKHAIFILATTEVHKLPATILSRCQRFDFHRISPQDIAKRLSFVAEQENVTITDDASLLIAVISDGAMRDSLSLLDRCIGISNEVTSDVVRKAAGLAQKSYLSELASCCINKNCAKALELINRLHGESKDMVRLCDELITHFRSLMIIKSVRNSREMLVMSEDEFEQAQTQSDYLTLSDIIYYMDVLQRCFARMNKGNNNRTEFEMAIVRLCSPQLDGTDEAILARLEALENAVKKGISVNSQPLSPLNTKDVSSQKTADKKPLNEEKESLEIKTEEIKQPIVTKAPSDSKEEAPVTPPQKPAESSSPANLDKLMQGATLMLEWPEIINHLKKYSRAISAAFENTNAYVNGNYLLIESEIDMPFQLLRQQQQRENIRNAVLEVTGRTYKLGPYKKPEKTAENRDMLGDLINKAKENNISVTEI